MLYRLIKDNSKIEYVTKKKFWAHLKYYYSLTPGFRKETCELLYMGGVIDTPLYTFCQSRDRLEKEL